MAEYTWQIEALDCVPNGNVVSCVHWRLKSDDGTNTAEVYGTQSIENNAKNTFISYENLRKDDVIGWVQENMGADKIVKLKEMLNKQLETLANPPIVSLPLPWVTQ
jgi:hypothetical protein